MSIQLLANIVEYFEDRNTADERFILCLKKALESLRELEGDDQEKDDLNGGLLEVALNRLENDFRRLLIENSFPLPVSSPTILGKQQACIAPSRLPASAIQKLQAILVKLLANGRLDKCISIYVEVRSSNVRASLQALNLDYLEISVSEFNELASIEVYVSKWSTHLEFAVKHLFEVEYKLCNDVFEITGSDVCKSCFAKIAVQGKITAFLQFGKTVTESKKDPIKLLTLLDIFSSLSKLRLDFNRLFDGAPCAEIRNLTRDLIKRVVQGACEIFWELLVQVERLRHTCPPLDCSVTKVVTFITDYCNKLLGDEYKPILTQVLVIERSWRCEKFQERMLTDELLKLVKAIELNLETWSKSYDDPVSSSLFLMNNHWHLYKNLKGTKLGELLGDSWLREHEKYKEDYFTMYLRESWEKLAGVLRRECLSLFSFNLVKQRLKCFNKEFDEMYKKQSKLVIADKEVRDITCQVIIQTIVPVYGPLIEQDSSASKYVKYTIESLEKMINALFIPKPVKQGSVKARHPNGKFDKRVVDQTSPTAK